MRMTDAVETIEETAKAHRRPFPNSISTPPTAVLYKDELAAIVFSCLIAAAAAMRPPQVPGWLAVSLWNLAAAAYLRAGVALCRHRGWPRLRLWLALPLYIVWFESSGHLVHLFFHGWRDRWLLRFSALLPGGEPSHWLHHLHSPALNEAMAFGYFSYYFTLPLAAWLLSRRHRLAALRHTFCASTLAYLACNLCYPLFPAAGPRMVFGPPLLGSAGFFSYCVARLEAWGGVTGCAFPSAHVAGALAAALCCRRYLPRLGLIYLALFALMCLATMYLRYHYFADVLAGLPIGGASYIASRRNR